MDKQTSHFEPHSIVQTTPAEALAHLYGVLNTMQDAVITLSLPDRRLIFVSASFEEVFGRPVEQFVSDKDFFKKIIPPEDLDFILQKQAECLRMGFVELDHRVIMPNGDIRWLHRRVWVNYDDHGTPIRMNDSASDITEYRRHKEELAQREANLRTLFNSVNDFLYVLDMQGNFKMVNRAVTERLGYSMDELTGKSVLMVHPESTQAEARQILDAMLRGEREYCPLPLQTKSGDIILAESRVAHGTWNGDPVLFAIVKDISLLKQSEQKFATAFHANPLMATLTETDTGILIDVNEAFCKRMGFSAHEVIGKTAAETIKLDAEQRRQAVERMREHGFVRDDEAILYTKSGEAVYVLISAQLFTVSDKTYTLTTALDMTERRKAEKALRESEEKYRSLINSSDAAIVMVDADGQYLFLNRIASLPYQASPEALIGKTVYELFPQDADKILRDVRRVIFRNEGMVLEPKVTIKDETHWFRTSIQPVCDATGKPYAAMIYSTEITGKKLVEQEILIQNEVLHQSHDLISFTDLSGHVMFINQGGATMMGYNKPEELIGFHIADFHFPEDTPSVLNDYIPHAIAHGFWRGENRLKTRHGDLVEVDQTIFSVRGMKDELTRIATIMIDITPKKRAQALLEQANSLLERRVIERTAELGRAKERIEAIFNYSGDAIVLLDVQHGIQQTNFAFHQMFMTDSDGAFRTRLRDWVVDEHQMSVYEAIQGVAETNQLVHTEAQGKRTDGTVLDIEISIAPIHQSETGVSDFVCIIRDISRRKQAELALRESEARYRFLAENIRDVIIRFSLKTGDKLLDRTFVTPSVYELTRYTADELMTIPALSLIYPDDYPDAVLAIREAIQSGKSAFSLMLRIVHKDGHPIWCECANTIVRDPQTGDPTEVISLVHDITERKQAELALLQRQAEEHEMQVYLKRLHEITLDLTRAETLDDFYRQVVEQGLSQFGFDRMGLLLHENGGARGTYGTDPQGKVVNESDLCFTPDQLSPAMRQTLTSQNRILFLSDTEHGFYRKPFGRGQRMIASLWDSIPLGWLSADNAVHDKPLSKAQRDIFALYALAIGHLLARKKAEFDLRESEARYRFLAENIKDVIAKLSPQGIRTFATPSVHDLLGYHPEEIVGKSAFEIIHPDDRERSRAILNNSLAADVTFFRVTQRFLHKNGHYIWAEVTNTIVRDPKTSLPIEVIGIIHDITERLNAEEAMQQSIQQEKELLDLKSRFVTMASHEFRTPLASILATTETLTIYRDKMDAQQINTRLDKIRQQVLHMKEMMEDVLQWAKMQAGRVEFKPIHGDLDALCKEIIEEFDIQAENRGRIVYRHDNQPLMVEYDITLMRQIISNLLSNGLKYSPSGESVYMSLSVHHDQLILSVTDKGIGIPESDIKRLFEPFHRAANVGIISGTGLGLSIAHQAVKAHGGEVIVNSQVGLGTTFTVVIPTQSQKDTIKNDEDISG